MTQTYRMTAQDYNTLAEKLNSKYPTLNATVSASPFGGRLEMEVSTVEKAKALREMFIGFTFTSGMYK